MSALSLLQMIQISDSLFPIGAFTLSNGLETMVLQEKLTTKEDLDRYVKNYMKLLPFNNLGIMMLAWQRADDPDFLRQLDEVSMAVKTPREVREGTVKLCRRFLKLWKQLREYKSLAWYQEEVKEGRCIGDHSIAVGLYAREIGLEQELAGAVYVYNLITSIVTNAVKTVPLSQIAGQQILNQALEQVEECVSKAKEVEKEDLGVGGTQMDIAAMNHETLYSRLYMS